MLRVLVNAQRRFGGDYTSLSTFEFHKVPFSLSFLYLSSPCVVYI